MGINQAFIGELAFESATTRKFLERVPEGKGDFRPHPKSMTLARLAGHVAELHGWGALILTGDSFDVAPATGPRPAPNFMTSRAQLLELFEKGVAGMQQALASTGDEAFMKPWSLLSGGKPMFTLPKVQVLRAMVFNHVVHHRAQLGVYLRLNDVAVPGAYGPSADER